MFNFDIDYIFLNLLLLYIFYVAGIKAHSGGYKMIFFLPCIISFSLTQGLRYGRGHDYFWYCYQFTHLYKRDDNQALLSLNRFLDWIGFNEYTCYIFYACVFVICAIQLLRELSIYSKWFYPLFIIGYIFFNEYMIRQALSYSFFFLFLKHIIRLKGYKDFFHKKGEVFYCGLYAFLCLLFHSANLLVVALFPLFYFLYRRHFRHYYTIPLYIACIYLLPALVKFDFFTNILSYISGGNALIASYAARTEMWMGDDAVNDSYTRNAIVQAAEAIGVSAYIYLGNKMFTDRPLSNNFLCTCFNLSIIGFCISALFRNYEIFARIGYVYSLTWCFVLAALLEYRYKLRTIAQKTAYIGLIWFSYEYLKYLFFRGEMTLFLWDDLPSIHYKY